MAKPPTSLIVRAFRSKERLLLVCVASGTECARAGKRRCVQQSGPSDRTPTGTRRSAGINRWPRRLRFHDGARACLSLRRLNENHFAVFDSGRHIDRLYCERMPGGVRWRCFLQAFDVAPPGIRRAGMQTRWKAPRPIFSQSTARSRRRSRRSASGGVILIVSGSPPLGIFQNDATGTVTISDVTADGSTSYGAITDVFSGNGGEVINAGTIDLEGEANGNTSAAPSIEVDSILNSGRIIAETGYVTLNDQTSGGIGDNGGVAGTLQIDANATLELGGPVANNTVLFSSIAPADPQTLVIDDLAEISSIDASQQQDFNATIAGFAPGSLRLRRPAWAISPTSRTPFREPMTRPTIRPRCRWTITAASSPR
jgi:hypothetical protein